MDESFRSYDTVFDGLAKGERSPSFWLPRAMALAAVIAGPLPLMLDLRLQVSMAATALVLWPVSVLLVIASVMLAARSGDRHFVKIVVVAILAGYMATATYDSTRVAGMSAGVTEMDEALDFGKRLTGQIPPGMSHDADHEGGQSAAASPDAAKHLDPQMHAGQDAPSASEVIKQKDKHGEAGQAPKHTEESTKAGTIGKRATVAIGYAWHYWAGIMFSLGFLLLFGARGWRWAIPYMVLLIYPGMVIAMGSHSLANFIWEALGHAGFGVTLGLVSRGLLASRQRYL